jgi:hypothetical protein
MAFRRPLAAALAAMVALTPALALPALAADPPATPPKVVIVVGAVESNTSRYRTNADQLYAEAIKYTPDVTKIYSPNATWAKVKAAAQGANLFIYLGHGYGFQSPYKPVLTPSVHDGMGLNEIGGVSDSDKKYYGESLIASEIRFAKDAVVILSGLCYAAGSSEDGDPPPTIPIARERVDNFASGWIRAGARAVIADSWTGAVVSTIRSLFTTDQTLQQVWTSQPNWHADEQPFIPQRNPQYDARLDPSGGFYRSFVGAMDMTTTQFRAGAATPSTAAATATVTDTTAPELWSVDGPTTITPNFDGDADTLNLLARWSETVTWSATIKDAEGVTVRTQAGSGFQSLVTWDGKVAGVPAPAGDYTWNLDAGDAVGNAAAAQSGPFTIEALPTPDTGVLSFRPTGPTITKTSTISYALQFAAPVTDLSAGDFTRLGTSTGCVVGAPTGAGTAWTITISACSTGIVGLYLNAGTVLDAALNLGPAGPIRAANVTIDTSAPTATAPRVGLRTAVALPTASATQAVLARINWSGTDSGAGIASYDVQRSTDGGAWTTIASATTATAMDVSLAPGHNYRFRARARDKAGNLGSFVASSTWYPNLRQQNYATVTYTGTWGGASSSAYSGSWVKYSSAAGATATFTFKGRAVAWLSTLRPTNGQVRVYVDGVLAATVDTYAATTAYRQVVWSRSWSTYASHTIKLVVVGTAGHSRADLDAFEVVG